MNDIKSGQVAKMNRRTVMISGVGGFLGQNLAQHFLKKEWNVIGITSRTQAEIHRNVSHLVNIVNYKLGDPVNEDILNLAPDVFIHCAHDFIRQTGSISEDSNVIGTLELYRKFRDTSKNTFFIFISSMAASDNAISRYGRIKFLIEKSLDPEVVAIVRPGTIIGNGGLFGKMVNAVRKLPMVPFFYFGPREIQYIGVEDLCMLLENLSTIKQAGLVNAAFSSPEPLSSFFKYTAKASGKSKPLLYLPGHLILWVVVIIEKLGIRLPFTFDNLAGLKNLKALPYQDLHTQFGVHLKSLPEIVGNWLKD